MDCQESITDPYIVYLVDQFLNKNIKINDLAAQSLQAQLKLSPDNRFKNYWDNGYRCRAVFFWSILDTKDKEYETLQRDFSGNLAFNGDVDVILKLMANMEKNIFEKQKKELIGNWRIMSNNKMPGTYKNLFTDKGIVKSSREKYKSAIEKMSKEVR